MKMRKIIIAALSLLAGASIAAGAQQVTATKASAATIENTTTFTMEEGAAARIKSLVDESGNTVESNGLRFSAEISSTEYEALKAAGAKFGAVIVAKDLAKTVEITEEAVFGASPSFYFSNETQEGNGKIAMLHVSTAACGNIDTDENVEICGSIVNLAVSNFTRSFIGRVYVAMPQTDASGAVMGYTYQFAPYYENKVENNTRCIYYVAQRAVEEKAENFATLQEKYIDEFAKTDRFTNYTYRYYIEHHYMEDDDISKEPIYTQRDDFYAQLNSEVSAYPIAKPLVDDLNGMEFVFDVAISQETQTGLVYAAGMQTLHMYYVKASAITEEDKDKTLETILKEFLSTETEDVMKNFDVNTTADGTWRAESITGADGLPSGINLITENPSKDQEITLSKDFFANLHAYGVETVSFSFYAEKNGQYISSYTMYKGDTDIDMPFTKTPTETDDNRVTIKISDLMEEGAVVYGLRFEIGNNASKNIGDYIFKDVTFGFPTKSTTEE